MRKAILTKVTACQRKQVTWAFIIRRSGEESKLKYSSAKPSPIFVLSAAGDLPLFCRGGREEYESEGKEAYS
jgi:hypothetical protein